MQESTKTCTGNLKEHWKQFISRHTYKDLTRSIRGFKGLASYEDDGENYFSLQRSRISGGGGGGELTVKSYMEGNSSIATGLLVKAKKQEVTSDPFNGSNAAVATPNFASVPLKRKEKLSVITPTMSQEPSLIQHVNRRNGLNDSRGEQFSHRKRYKATSQANRTSF